MPIFTTTRAPVVRAEAFKPLTLETFEVRFDERMGKAQHDILPLDISSPRSSVTPSMTSSRSSFSWSTASPPESPRSPTFRPPILGSSTAPSIDEVAYVNSLLRSRQSMSISHRSYPSLQSVSATGRVRAIDRLPHEVLSCIAKQLSVLHTDPIVATCSTCLLRDLHSMSMTNKIWRRSARTHMYRSIWLVGEDSTAQTKKLKMKHGARLKLLRRTLRENRILAGLVRELKVPETLISSGIRDAEQERYRNLVASVVMSCPNLESLAGFYPSYDHSFDRLTHALSTRQKLKEHVWVITANEGTEEKNLERLPQGRLRLAQAEMFLHHHRQWECLETLFLHSRPTGVLKHDLFVEIFRCLPSLKNLCVSNFSANDFGDGTLLALPALDSLRLQNLHGITDQGILQFASRPTNTCIRSLGLINLEIMNLAVLSKVFANLRSLEKFTFIQDSSPELPLGGLILQPIIASPTLEVLHWDVLIPGSANTNLVSSIKAQGFPRLRQIRAPSDHHGTIQDVCRPIDRIALAADRFNRSLRTAAPVHSDRYGRTLYAARQAAQERIEQARAQVKYKIVIEEDGEVKQVFKINGYMGIVGSPITYSLTPDMHGSDNAVIEIPDLLDVSKELEVRNGCKGDWNSRHPSGRKWSSHKERSHYKKIDLGRFF